MSNNNVDCLLTIIYIHFFRYFINCDDGYELYRHGYLYHVRMVKCSNGYVYLKSECNSASKKDTKYEVDIKLEPNSEIDATHCECAVGSGSTAHCKHVVAVLWAIEHLASKGKIILHTTCTQNLQNHHKPKKTYFGTPIKSDKMYQKHSAVNFLTVNPEIIDADKIREKTRNLCISFAAIHKRDMPILHTYKPANTYAAVFDHEYQNENSSPQNILLKSLNLFDITHEKIKEIEAKTRLQRFAAMWAFERKHHLTASNVGIIMDTVSDEAKKNLAKKLFNPQPVFCKATDHGVLYEAEALALYELKTGIRVKKCGLFISKSHPHIAASPDGLVGTNTVIEVKCPYNQRNSEINEETIPYLLKNPETNELMLDATHSYYKQIQIQLFATERKYAKLVVYTFKGIEIINVHRNQNDINQIVSALTKFYNKYFKPLILEEYLFKNYNSIFLKI